MPDAVAPVREGEVLGGKYRVDRVLGVGGMGVVVAATHVQLHTKVALKFLLPSALANTEVIERFAREARAAVQIQSEHVARVSDVGTLPTGSPYMVMEYLEGGDLEDLLAKSGPLPVEQAVGYVLQACEAVAEAHSLGIVHRDLKPSNLYVATRHGRDPIVKVLDFGISKTTDAASSGALTATAAVMGSPFYMAPEQMMSSKDVDARADVWAIGVILYELLTGASPFAADTMAEAVFRVTQRDPAPLREQRPDVAPGLAAAVARCLMRDRGQRFQNVAELAVAIAPFGPARSDVSVERVSRLLGTDARPGSSTPTRTSGARASTGEARTPAPGTSATWARSQGAAGAISEPDARSSKTKAWVVAVVLVLALAAVAVAVAVVGLRGGRKAEGQSAASVPEATSGASAAPPSVTTAEVLAATAPAAASSPPPAPEPTDSVTAAPSVPVSPPHERPAFVTARPRAPPPTAAQPSPTPAPQPTNRLNMGLKE